MDHVSSYLLPEAKAGRRRALSLLSQKHSLRTHVQYVRNGQRVRVRACAAGACERAHVINKISPFLFLVPTCLLDSTQLRYVPLCNLLFDVCNLTLLFTSSAPYFLQRLLGKVCGRL